MAQGPNSPSRCLSSALSPSRVWSKAEDDGAAWQWDSITSRPAGSRRFLFIRKQVMCQNKLPIQLKDTSQIEHNAPRTWDYLQSPANLLDRRASIIYKNRPRFSVFGIGPYSFAPWKVAISGFYKRLDFRCIGPVDGKPVILDDTCYFLPCQTEDDAGFLANMVNSKSARGFFRSFIFRDARRPVTVQLLGSLDLGLLAKEIGTSLPAWPDVALFGKNQIDYRGYEKTRNTTRFQYELYPR